MPAGIADVERYGEYSKRWGDVKKYHRWWLLVGLKGGNSFAIPALQPHTDQTPQTIAKIYKPWYNTTSSFTYTNLAYEREAFTTAERGFIEPKDTFCCGEVMRRHPECVMQQQKKENRHGQQQGRRRIIRINHWSAL